MTSTTAAEDKPLQWIVADFVLSWRDPSCEWTLRPYRRTFASGELTVLSVGATYGFLMVAPARALDALTFDFAGPMAGALGLWVELTTAEGVVLRRAFVDARMIQSHGQAPVMDLSGLRFEIGAKLHVRLDVAALEDSAEVYIAATPQPTTGLAFDRKMTRLRNEREFVYDRPEAVAGSKVLVLPADMGLGQAKPVLELLASAFPGENFTGVYSGPLAELWPKLERAEMVAFADFHGASRDLGSDYDRLCFELSRRGSCTLAVDTQTLHPSPLSGGPVERTVKAAIEDQQRCRFILRGGDHPVLCGAEQPLEPLAGAPPLGHAESLSALLGAWRSAMLPKVAVISALGGQTGDLQAFLEQIRLQTYPGEIVTVLMDDGAPGRGGVAEAFQQRLQALGHDNRSVRILTGGGRRRSGLKVEEADIYVILDRAYAINRDFIAAHVFEHAHPEVDVVIGPSHIGPIGANPAALLEALEQHPERIGRGAGARDPIQPDGFLNCAHGNVSIKRAALPEGLFDGDPRLLAGPGHGLDLEEVEMGYRLYAGGGRLRFTTRAFSVRAEEPARAADAADIESAVREFEGLFARNEDLALAARRWAVDSFDKLMSAADRNGIAADDARLRLEARFSTAREWQAPLIAVMRGQKRRLRVLSYRWHATHQYELYKLPHDFTLATGVGDNGMVERWSYDQRPLRANARLRPASEIDPADYDLAVLHFDENVLAPELCNNTIPAAWGDPFQWLLRTDLPKVAICHGTPQFVGQYGADAQPKAAFTPHEDERQRLIALLAAADVHVVCNSHQARAEWGFASSEVIWHGFDPQEFPQGRGDLDILALDPDPHRPHYRGAWEQVEVEARLDPTIRLGNARHFGGALEVRGTNAYATSRFRAYVARIGRFKAYLNTTLRSPMPRSRGEAMMTGVVPVCLDNHDVSLFIDNGADGFYADEPAALADFLNHLCRNESEARRMRAAARRKALNVFNHDRYLAAWAGLMERTAR